MPGMKVIKFLHKTRPRCTQTNQCVTEVGVNKDTTTSIMLVDYSHRCDNHCRKSAKFSMQYTFLIN